MGIEISLCMIVKNEENNLDNCLKSVYDLVDEINIIDTGSTDNTINVASKYTDRIFHFEWISDFAAARNFSFSKATKEYIMWLDADDTLTKENREKIKILKKTLARNVNVVYMDYHYSFDQNGKLRHSLIRERIVKTSCEFKWEGIIHECLEVSGKSFVSDIFVTHNHTQIQSYASSNRNLEIIEQQRLKGELSPRDTYYYALLLLVVDRKEEGLEQLKKALSAPASETVGMLMGFLYMHRYYIENGDYDNALLILINNEALFKDKSEFYCALGDFYSDVRNDIDKSIEYFSKALTCKGHDGNAGLYFSRTEDCYYFKPLNALAYCFITLKRYDEALDCFKKSLSFKKTDETLQIIPKLERMVELTNKK